MEPVNVPENLGITFPENRALTALMEVAAV